MRIMAVQAIGLAERLPLVRREQSRILGVVTGLAKCRSIFRKVEVEFSNSPLAGLVRDMAGVAAHIHGGVMAAVFCIRQAGLMAGKAEVLVLVASGGGLEQLELIVRGVRIMALHAIAHCRRVDLPLDVGGLLVRMAGEAEAVGGGCLELDAGRSLRDADLVTA